MNEQKLPTGTDEPFVWHENYVAISVATNKDKDDDREADFILCGSLDLICASIVYRMTEHPTLAKVITTAAENFIKLQSEGN